MPQTLYDKLWDSHVVHVEDDGTTLLYIDRHLVHEVTSAQAYEGLRLAGRKPWRIDSVVATADHNTPTTNWDEGLAGVRDPFARLQIETLDANIKEFGAKVYFPYLDKRQGIVHVIGPEQGATLPGMTVVCGDSHTSTHGAFACFAHGIGTSEVEHVLATQCLVTKKMKNMRVNVEGPLARGVTAKDVVLAIIGRIGTAGGTGHAIEFPGSALRALSMEGRMTVCNMAIAVVKGRRIASNVKLALVVPGSGIVKQQAEHEGLDRVFRDAGFEWREPGCSMCLGMNPDRLNAGERCASTSNRNFEGRQGPGGRTHLVSPAMAAAAAIAGHFVDIRRWS